MRCSWICLALLFPSPTCALRFTSSTDVSPPTSDLSNHQQEEVVASSTDSDNRQPQISLDPSVYLLSDIPGNTLDIPHILHQTTELLLDCVPNLSDGFADGLERRVTNDKMSLEFLKTYFSPNVTTAFGKLKGPHRADLYRYAALYVFGGIYADIKIMPLVQITSVFKSNSTKFTWYSTTSGGTPKSVFNGLMASPPRNPHFLQVIAYIVEHAPPGTYSQYCNADADLLNSQFKVGTSVNNRNKLRSGTFETEDYKLVLLDEDCGHKECEFVKKRDRYNLCCNIYDSDVDSVDRRMVAHTRDPDYPKGAKWQKCVEKSFSAEPHHLSEEDAKHSKNIWNEVIRSEDQWLSTLVKLE